MSQGVATTRQDSNAPEQIDLQHSICDLISQVLRTEPDRTAISSHGSDFSYKELETASNRLASTLQSKGVGPGDRIPIVTTRCSRMVVCFLSVLKLGACYVPIDLDSWSAERITITLAIINPRVVITTGLDTYSLYDVVDNQMVEDALHPANGISLSSLQVSVHPSDTAYIIFTSGTTSEPKGVIVPHRALSNYVQHGGSSTPFNMNVTPSDTVLLLFSVAFDGELRPALVHKYTADS